MSHQIYVTDYLRRQFKVDKDVEKKFNISLLQYLDEKDLFPTILNADALIVDKTKITSYTFQRLERCRIVVRMGVGFDNVDLKAAAEKKIYVCNIPDFCTEEVADHAIALLLSLSRSLTAYHSNLLQGSSMEWSPILNVENQRLRDKVLGVVGLGRIGMATALRAKAFGLKVCFYDPYLPAGYEKSLGFERTSELYALANKSDFVSFHTPLSDETRHLCDEKFFEYLKRGACIINTSRGPVIKTDALMQALETGKISKAALDVFEKEPIEFTHPLFKRWLESSELQNRLVLTPHSAFYSKESEDELREKAIAEIERVLTHQKPVNCVNLRYFSF